MVFPVAMLFEDWQREVAQLQREHKAYCWYLGDSVLYGQERFGELYAQAIENYSIETIQMAMRVCRAFPAERRRKCGFSFHQAVIKLEPTEQDELLDAATREDWTREQMREEIRRRREERERAKQPELPVEPDAKTEENYSDNCSDPAEPAPPDPLHQNKHIWNGSATEIIPPGPVPISTDDAAVLLRSIAHSALPGRIGQAVIAILDERDAVVDVLRAAQGSVVVGQLLPDLGRALDRLALTRRT